MNLSYLRFAVFSLILLAAQGAVFSRISVLGAFPDLLLAFSVVCGLMGGASAGLAAGLFLGLLQDTVYGTGFMFLLGLGFAGLISGSIKGAVIRDEFGVSIGISFVSMLLFHLFYGLIFRFFGQGDPPFFRTVLLISPLINLLLMPVLIEAYRKVFRDG